MITRVSCGPETGFHAQQCKQRLHTDSDRSQNRRLCLQYWLGLTLNTEGQYDFPRPREGPWKVSTNRVPGVCVFLSCMSKFLEKQAYSLLERIANASGRKIDTVYASLANKLGLTQPFFKVCSTRSIDFAPSLLSRAHIAGTRHFE